MSEELLTIPRILTTYYRRLVFAWFYPVAFYAERILSSHLETQWTFWLISVPLGIVCVKIASMPYETGRVTHGQMLCVMGFPALAIWALLVFFGRYVV